MARRYLPETRLDVAVARAVVPCLLLAVSGCAREYRPPTASEPHAVLEVRRVYESQQGESLREVVSVDQHAALTLQSRAVEAATARGDKLLIHPRPATLALSSTFFHNEMRTVQESYTVQVPYTTTESYSCGDYKSYRTCTRPVTRYRPETKYRTVTKNVEVVDGSCERAFRLAPVEGRVYTVDLVYLTPKACRLECAERSRSSKAGSSGADCPLAPSEE